MTTPAWRKDRPERLPGVAPNERRQKRRRNLSVLAYCLVVVAVLISVMATWTRYSRRRRLVGPSREPGDAIERRVHSFGRNLPLAGPWTQAAGPSRNTSPRPLGQAVPLRVPDLRPARTCRFVCRRCQTSCWTGPRLGCPACPFCGRMMARQGGAVSLVGGTGTWRTASPIPIQVGAVSPHRGMGVCTNCHTVIKSGVPLSGFALVAAAPSPTFRPAQWTAAAQVWPCPSPVWRNAAARATTPGNARPPLIKEFGIEIRQPPGAGAEVTGVMGSSPAWNAGLRAGDIIIGFNGSKVRGALQFQRLASLAAPETNASIHILRNGRTRDLSIMVGEGEMEGFTPIQRM